MQNWILFEDVLMEHLQDPEYAKIYLEGALKEYSEDHDMEALLSTIRHITKAHSGLDKLADKVQLDLQGLYKILSGKERSKLGISKEILHDLKSYLPVSELR